MKYIYSMLIVIGSMAPCLAREKGYFCAPVADLLLKPIQSKRTSRSVEESYNTLSLQPEQGSYACPRAHQGLFNEQVIILQEEGEEVQIEITNCFFDSAFYRERQSRYWTLRKWLISEQEIKEKGLDAEEIFPAPINYSEGYFDSSVITLLTPWYDPMSKITFSAGTRFAHDGAHCTPHAYDIKIYDPNSASIIQTAIPKQLARTGVFATEKDQQKAFIDLLYSWIDYDTDSIPYVWGGVSFIGRVNGSFELQSQQQHCEECFAWVRPEIKERPITGLDCSCMILRAAQAVDIPYYYKNAATVCNYLKPLTPSDSLEAGDILWTPGHVVVVGNIAKNEMIEATGYHMGYGKMHAVPLSQKYKDMNSWQDLVRAYYNGRPLEVLNIDGSVRAVVSLYRLLKFSSVSQLQKIEKKSDDF